jgi:hypothetical protein
MKATIAGLATGLMLAGAPAFADSWKDESGHSWRAASVQQVRHGDNRWERRRSHERHYQPRAHQRDWDRHYHYYRQYQPAPRHRHYYRDHTYGYYAPDAYSSEPSVWFSWTVR